MIKNNRNNEKIYGRNDMIMLDQNNKIYGSLGIADKYIMKTEEGTRLVLSNPKSGRFGDVLTEFNMYGRSEQKQYRGKNLLKIRDGVQTTRGVTVIAKDGVVALKGTATATGWTVLKIDSFILNGTYILSSNLTDVTVKLANKSYEAVISQNESKTLENEEVSILCFVVKEGKTYDVSNILVQIEKGSEVTSYEPYVGGKPSPSPDYPQEIKSVVNPVVKVCGKNLFDFSRLVSDGVNMMDYEKQTITVPAKTNNTGYNQTLRDLCPGITPGTYVFSAKRSNPESGNGSYFLEAGLDFTFNTPIELTDALLDNHIAWYNNRDSDVENVISEIQIEKGNVVTSYEPYKEEQTVTLPYTLNAIPVLSGGNYIDQSGQQWICDEINLKRGVKVQRVYEVNVDGENINFVQSDRYANISVRGLPIALVDNGQRIYGISTFTSLSWFFNAVSGQFLYLIEPDISDKINESCKKQIGKIYYALETPIETALTHAEISAYKALSTKTPTTIIENNYNTWMKATYKSTESV